MGQCNATVPTYVHRCILDEHEGIEHETYDSNDNSYGFTVEGDIWFL